MVIGLSYVLAVVFTAVLACILYPIAGVFWLIGLLGKLGEKLFEFSNHAIKSLWADISNKKIVDVSAQNQDNQPVGSPASSAQTSAPDNESAVNLTKR